MNLLRTGVYENPIYKDPVKRYYNPNHQSFHKEVIIERYEEREKAKATMNDVKQLLNEMKQMNTISDVNAISKVNEVNGDEVDDRVNIPIRKINKDQQNELKKRHVIEY